MAVAAFLCLPWYVEVMLLGVGASSRAWASCAPLGDPSPAQVIVITWDAPAALLPLLLHELAHARHAPYPPRVPVQTAAQLETSRPMLRAIDDPAQLRGVAEQLRAGALAELKSCGGLLAPAAPRRLAQEDEPC